MGGLSSLLYIGASGLNVSQQGVRAASDNIANVDTPGFNRRETIQSTRPSVTFGGVAAGAGVQSDGVRRVVDEALGRRLLEADSQAGFAEARANALRQAESVFGDLEGGGISDGLDRLFAAFDQLAIEPQDTGARQQVLELAGQFAEDVNFVSSELSAQQLELDRKLAEQVDQINALSESIADLNLSIGGLDQPPPDLLDKRDQAVADLSRLVGINVVESEQRLQVSLKGSGFGLVTDGVVRPLDTAVVGGQAVITGLRNGVSEDLTATLNDGELTGTLEARNVDLQATLDGLDQFAFEMANAINTVHSAGYGTDGVNGRNLFTVTATAPGAAGALTVDPTVAGQPDRIAAATDPLLVPGDNRNAVALAELRQSALASGSTPGESLRGVLADFGNRMSSASTSVEARTALTARLSDLQSGLSGVSLDEEMTKLLQFRQAYAAAARVIQTADELMQEVVSLKR